MFSMSTKMYKKYVDKAHNGTYNVLKGHEKRARWEHMELTTAYADTVEKKKDDAKELVAILNKIPEEKKGEVIGIVKGYALCAENQRVRWGKIKTSEIIMTAIVWVFAIAGIAITQKLEPHNKIYTVWIGLTVVVYMLLVALKLIS